LLLKSTIYYLYYEFLFRFLSNSFVLSISLHSTACRARKTNES